MRRTGTLVLALLVALAVAVGAPAAAKPKLTGTVGPGFTITLTQGSKKVGSLKPGKVTFVIRDKSGIHNFHLKGPGVDKRTSVSGTGTTKWTVTLKRGTYRYVCDPHASVMKGSFRVK